MAETNYFNTPPKVMGVTNAATITLDPTVALNFKWSPNEDEAVNAASPGMPGQVLTIWIDTINTTTRTLTFGATMRTTGTLATGTTAARRFVLTFVSDGQVWSEVSRTAAMA